MEIVSTRKTSERSKRPQQRSRKRNKRRTGKTNWPMKKVRVK